MSSPSRRREEASRFGASFPKRRRGRLYSRARERFKPPSGCLRRPRAREARDPRPAVHTGFLNAKQSALAAGAVIAALYLVTRVVLLWRFPPFWDEGQYAGWAHDGFVDADQRFVALANGKQPMLPWLGMPVIGLGAEPLTAVRIVSGAAGLVTLAMMGLIGHRLGGLRVGLAAAAVGAFVPYLLVHNSLGIMEPLVVAATTTALYLQLRLAEEPRLDIAVLAGLVLGVGLLTKDTAAVALVLMPLSLLCLRWEGPDLKRRLAAWIGCSAIALTVALAAYSTLRLSDLYDDFGRAREQIAMFHDYGDAVAHPGRYAEDNWPLFRAALAGYMTVPLVLAAAVGAGLALRTKPRLGGVLAAWVVVPLGGVSLLAISPWPRYAMVAVPALGIFAAYGLVRTLDAIAGRHRLAAAALGVVALIPALVFDARVLADPAGARYPALDDAQLATGWTAGQAIVELAHELERRAHSPTTVELLDIGSPPLSILLLDRPDIVLVGPDPAPGARYSIENGSRLRGRNGLVELRPVWEARRPRGGTPVTLLERGVVWNGGFHSTPEALRAAIGTDAEFDAFVASHPEVDAWYRSATQLRRRAGQG
jgi:4-amino-4-deoxy-L-arabinose transferase-like glycosyltransferase